MVAGIQLVAYPYNYAGLSKTDQKTARLRFYVAHLFRGEAL